MLDAELDGLDAGLATVKATALEGGVEGQSREDGVEEEEEASKVMPSTQEERREAKRKLKEEQKKLKVCVGLFRWLTVRVASLKLLGLAACGVVPRGPVVITFSLRF